MRDVTFQFRTDSIAQEPNETFSLELQPGSGVVIPTEEGVFFLNVVNMTIIDGDGKRGVESMDMIYFLSYPQMLV